MTIFSLFLALFVYKIAKNITDLGKAFHWDGPLSSETPKSVSVVVFGTLSILLFWVGAYNTLDTLPRGIAAIMEPQGFAVQMLIEGIKK